MSTLVPMFHPHHPCYQVDFYMCEEKDIESARGQGYISLAEFLEKYIELNTHLTNIVKLLHGDNYDEENVYLVFHYLKEHGFQDNVEVEGIKNHRLVMEKIKMILAS